MDIKVRLNKNFTTAYNKMSEKYGVTILKARGGYLGEKENVLMCVLPTKDYYKLTEGIKEIDKDAFFLVTDAYEVFGGD